MLILYPYIQWRPHRIILFIPCCYPDLADQRVYTLADPCRWGLGEHLIDARHPRVQVRFIRIRDVASFKAQYVIQPTFATNSTLSLPNVTMGSLASPLAVVGVLSIGDMGVGTARLLIANNFKVLTNASDRRYNHHEVVHRRAEA